MRGCPAPIVWLVLPWALACGLWGGGSPGRGPARNVLLITVDALRPDHLGAYGYPRPTSPSIDALARGGCTFEAAYAIYPKTGPSLASLVTGAFPRRIHNWAVDPRLQTLAELLAARGFRTMAAVDNAHLSREFGYHRGFELYVETWMERDTEAGRMELITATAVAELEGLARSRRPFFMWLHYASPHVPYTPPETYVAPFLHDAYFDGSRVLPRTPTHLNGIAPVAYVEGERRLDAYIARYDGEIAFADDQIGRVLEALRSHPRGRDTLVVLSADHGESLGEWGLYFEHGNFLNEPNLRVPLILSGPPLPPEPCRVAAPVTLMDVTPTILEAVGVAAPAATVPSAFPVVGRSLLPLIRGEVRSLHPYLYFASPTHWAVRSGSLKLIVRARAEELTPDNFGLYDLGEDPMESENLFAPDHPAFRQLWGLLQQRMELQVAGLHRPKRYYRMLRRAALDNLRALGYVR